MEKNPFNEELQEAQDLISEAEEEEKEDSDKNTEEENEPEEHNEYKEKYEELNNKYIRLAADFDNFRKRTVQEKEELSEYSKGEVLKQLTGVLDTFDRAQTHLENVEDAKTIKEGYEMAFRQLIETLKKIGLVEIEALGKAFNPNEHEAITQVPTEEFEQDTVALVAQKGYKLGNRVIRPALVGVAKPANDTNQEEKDKENE